MAPLRSPVSVPVLLYGREGWGWVSQHAKTRTRTRPRTTGTADTTETSVACGRAACGGCVCACACITCKGDPLVARGDICTEAAPHRRCSRAQSRSQSPLPTRMMEMKWGLRASCCARWSWGGRGIGVGRGLRRKQRGTDPRGSVQSSNVRRDVQSQRAHRAWSSIQ